MAVVQLADVYVPEPFEADVDEKAIELNAFLASGIMVTSPKLSGMATVGGSSGDLPFFNNLNTAQEPDYTNATPADLSVPQKIDSGLAKYRLASMHGSWSTMDLARELALRDPLAAIIAKVGGWWATQKEKRVIQSSMGILADNVANDGGDMLYSIATDAVGAPAAAELVSAEAVLTAKQTMGDHAESLAAIAMHSVVFTRLQIQQLIDYIPSARAEVLIPTYLGYRVIVDDSMPAIAGVNRITYTTILYALGAIDHGDGMPEIPSEMERIAGAGNGGGQDIIHSRSSDIIAPFGFTWTDTTIVGQSATLAELADATNWNRVRDRKNIGIAFLQTNG